ncbi:hypothetical protein [Fischerella sp. JS2]|nr:hypothetical protein [Fischerella sp. JS2]
MSYTICNSTASQSFVIGVLMLWRSKSNQTQKINDGGAYSHAVCSKE